MGPWTYKSTWLKYSEVLTSPRPRYDLLRRDMWDFPLLVYLSLPLLKLFLSLVGTRHTYPSPQSHFLFFSLHKSHSAEVCTTKLDLGLKDSNLRFNLGVTQIVHC